jgi:hypothetical protein
LVIAPRLVVPTTLSAAARYFKKARVGSDEGIGWLGGAGHLFWRDPTIGLLVLFETWKMSFSGARPRYPEEAGHFPAFYAGIR